MSLYGCTVIIVHLVGNDPHMFSYKVIAITLGNILPDYKLAAAEKVYNILKEIVSDAL